MSSNSRIQYSRCVSAPLPLVDDTDRLSSSLLSSPGAHKHGALSVHRASRHIYILHCRLCTVEKHRYDCYAVFRLYHEPGNYNRYIDSVVDTAKAPK